ncbi:MAG: peptidoglycan-associated lipoprotein Pal [Deltaproteobacteria bacterium]
MKDGGGVRWPVVLLAVVLSVSLGCARKEVVKSTDTGAAAGSSEMSAGAKEGGIVTETVPPERSAGMEETRTAMTERAEAAETAGAAVTLERPSSFPDIHFDFDQSFIREDAKPILATIADAMKAGPPASLLIEGHCDERGTAEYNLALGERRAEATKKYLVSLGVRAASLSTVSFGEEKPVDPGHTEEAWAKNRRAHFVVK